MSRTKRGPLTAAEIFEKKRLSLLVKASTNGRPVKLTTGERKALKAGANIKIGEGHRTLTFLFKRDGGKCFWCGDKLRLEDAGQQTNRKMPTKDHILPKVKGGTCNVNNLVLACQDCNNIKGSRPINPRTGWRVNHEILSVLIKE